MTTIHMNWGKLELTAEGHTGSAPAGQDIICAGISAIITGLGQYLLADEDGLRPELEIEPGYTTIRARPLIWKWRKAKAAFYQAMLGLELIAEQHAEYVRIEEE